MSFIKDIYRYTASQTVFSLTDLSSINSGYVGPKLNSAIKYLVKNKELIRLSKGLYALSENYSKEEFGNKFRIPSYVSLYTVLFKSSVVFQPYSSIYLVSKRSEIKTIRNEKYIYRKIMDKILLNPIGIENIDGVFRASKERAICDKIYLDDDEYFDNLREIDWEKINLINQEVYNGNGKILQWISKNTK